MGPNPSYAEASDEQRKAITAPVDRAVRVLAGPGAGKTSVIAWRYHFLLQNGARPEQILAVTYSKDMAQELQQRIKDLNPQVGHNDQALRQICTIHAICYRILIASGDERQLPKAGKMSQALKDLAARLWPDAIDRPEWQTLEQWLVASKADGLLLDFDGQEPDAGDVAALRANFTKLLGAKCATKVTEARIALDSALRANKLITFPDMLLDVERRLERNSDFRKHWRARFKWIIIDEAQDTSRQAGRILYSLAAPENQVFTVGDADQTLFRWAGGAPEFNLYKGFETTFPKCLTFMLQTNYRSTKSIVRAQMRLICHNYQPYGGQIHGRYLKMLQPRPDAPEGAPVDFRWYETPEAEAAGVVAKIKASLASGVRQPGDFFIGARTRGQLAYLEDALSAEGLPYVNIAGQSFWQLGHVQDVIAYIALACNRSDEAAFRRVHNIPSQEFLGSSRGLGDTFMEACSNRWAGLDEAVERNARWRRGVEDLRNYVLRLEMTLNQAGTAAAVRFVLDTCYYPYLERRMDGKPGRPVTSGDMTTDDWRDELKVLMETAARFRQPAELVAYARQMQRETDRGDRSKRIVISTIHRLKGQQRKVVFGIGWSEGEDKHGCPVGQLPHTHSLRADDPVALSDERCVAFVLLSRAQEECHVSGVELYQGMELQPSRFVQEAELVFRDEAAEWGRSGR